MQPSLETGSFTELNLKFWDKAIKMQENFNFPPHSFLLLVNCSVSSRTFITSQGKHGIETSVIPIEGQGFIICI